jgi:hypothetical protein
VGCRPAGEDATLARPLPRGRRPSGLLRSARLADAGPVIARRVRDRACASRSAASAASAAFENTRAGRRAARTIGEVTMRAPEKPAVRAAIHQRLGDAPLSNAPISTAAAAITSPAWPARSRAPPQLAENRARRSRLARGELRPRKLIAERLGCSAPPASARSWRRW